MKLLELTKIAEQKDRLFSQQTDAELQRHIHSKNEFKQQHEVLLSTLLLEQQQLHLTATKEHKRVVKEFISMNSTCYDDSTKDHLGLAACQGNIVEIV
ncbi:unnamed protein product [Rotaria socialis]|uniref:Uncharacterized protein n=1 Tax=Rotaria socialis TaxID=392032 RepID=A0A821T5K6_9BILA|nr:unnamed protein product [Rotaria socialis]